MMEKCQKACLQVVNSKLLGTKLRLLLSSSPKIKDFHKKKSLNISPSGIRKQKFEVKIEVASP
jgi:hypothetical protein